MPPQEREAGTRPRALSRFWTADGWRVTACIGMGRGWLRGWLPRGSLVEDGFRVGGERVDLEDVDFGKGGSRPRRVRRGSRFIRSGPRP
jgi:hypothetical protein